MDHLEPIILAAVGAAAIVFVFACAFLVVMLALAL